MVTRPTLDGRDWGNNTGALHNTVAFNQNAKAYFMSSKTATGIIDFSPLRTLVSIVVVPFVNAVLAPVEPSLSVIPLFLQISSTLIALPLPMNIPILVFPFPIFSSRTLLFYFEGRFVDDNP